jgi:hypothetical protein
MNENELFHAAVKLSADKQAKFLDRAFLDKKCACFLWFSLP